MDDDIRFMERALELAAQGRYSTSPNPMVGCVIVREGRIVGEGFHRRAGEAHAEVEAMRSAGAAARDATMYVTLEPCVHHGRTPPCAEAVIAAGVRRVVIAAGDPHPMVDGRGIAALRAAGIEVVTGALAADARTLNERFEWAVKHDVPFVLLKMAMTLDGKLATVARESRWITGDAARQRSLELREEYDAILIGSGTLATDNPHLTRRLGRNTSSPWLRVILDGTGRCNPDRVVFNDAGATLLFTPAPPPNLRSSVEVVVLPARDGRLDIDTALRELHRRGVQSVIVEGGSMLHSEFIRLRTWQKLIAFIAPAIVGGAEAPSIFSGEAVTRLTDAYRFRFDRAELIGGDVMITAYPVVA